MQNENTTVAQIVHDIRSPLMALEILSKRLSEVETSKRQLLCEAIQHIKNIVTKLEKNSQNNSESIKLNQLALLINYVVTECRTALSDHPIQIICDLESECYNYFVQASSTDLKRVITNIIHNACEAVLPDGGEVNITITQENNHAVIKVCDNGCGITLETQSSLFTPGFTTKNRGSGLGLSYAKENIEQWGGRIEITSNQKNGVTFHIYLPLQQSPPWFINQMLLKENATIVCFDHNPAIADQWRQRLQTINTNIQLHYCCSKEDVLSITKLLDKTPCTYLIEYEYPNNFYTGIDVYAYIRSLGVKENKVYMVIHHTTDEKIQYLCQINAIQMIPKEFIEKIPIMIEKLAKNNLITT